jgi:glycopeptide antibiotics resistance protein
MRWKLFVEFCFTVSIICLIAGDLFLPQPYRSGSQQLKTNLNHFIVSLLPRKAIINFDTNTDTKVNDFYA